MRDHQSSATASLIAKSTVFMSRDQTAGHLVPSLAAEASAWFLQTNSRRSQLLLDVMDRRWFRFLVKIFEQLTTPGIQLHFLLRKRYIEDAVRSNLHQGVKQVVIFGAGFDTLALRLHLEFPEGRFIEVDHPATQRMKIKTLEAHRLPRDNMKFVPADFDQKTLRQILLDGQEYDRSANTLYLAEGVLMYLNPDDVGAIFDFLREHGGTTCRVIFTFMEPQTNGRIRFKNSSRTVNLWLWMRNETFKWGILREDIQTYLNAKGFRLLDISTPEIFLRRYLPGEQPSIIPLAEGEYVCVAERF